MRARSCIVLSVIACNLLMGADYTDWNKTDFQNGDKVTIDQNSKLPSVLTNKNISLTSGKLTVVVDASSISNSPCGIIACYNAGGYTIGSTGSTIDFILTGGTNASQRGAFEIRESSLAFGSNVSINASGSNVEDVFQVANSTLTFNGDVMIRAGNGKRAINGGGSTVNLGQSGKKVDITGDLKFTNHSQVNIKLSEQSSKIMGDIKAETGAKIKLEMLSGSTITGSFNGIGGTNLELNSIGGVFTGNIANEGGETRIDLKNQGKINGGITVSGATFASTLDNGAITGNIFSTASTNTLTMSGTSNIGGSVTFGGSDNTLDLKGSSKILGGVENKKGTLKITLKDTSIIQNGITSSGTTATINLDKKSILSGNSRLSNATSSVTLVDSAKVQGNITFAGEKNTLKASNDSNLIGGIDTQSGETTAIFQDNSKIQNGTSNFDAKTSIIFKSNAQANNETFNIRGGETNITFQDSSKMNNGAINNRGGTANIIFKDNAQMNDGMINAIDGTTKLEAKNNAKLSNAITQSGGTMDVDFSDRASFEGNISQSGGTSTIDFKDQTTMKGNIDVSWGSTTEITFKNTAKITGDVNAQGIKNTVTFTNGTELNGNLRLDNESKATFTGSKITQNVESMGDSTVDLTTTEISGYFHQITDTLKLTMNQSLIKDGFVGNQDSINEIKMEMSQIEKGVKQDTGSLTLTTNQSVIKGGFEGTNNSINKITMTNGKLEDGIVQNTGGLDFLSYGTSIAGGFMGIDSTNTLQVANGNFNNGDIIQTNGELLSELVNVANLKDFRGTNSRNVIHLINTEIKNITQSGGSLEFQTDSLVDGNIKGDQASENKITVIGADVKGNITQEMGGMRLQINNSNVKGEVKSDGANFGLYATSVVFEKNLELKDSNSTGISENLTINGVLTQTGGISNLSFVGSRIGGKITLTNTTLANLVFTKSEIQNVEATNGVTSINLTESTMKNFTGNYGDHSVILIGSSGEDYNQSGGSLSISGSAASTIKSVQGKAFSNIVLSLSSSEVSQDVSNEGGDTAISMQDSKISGNVLQTRGNMSLNAINSSIEGKYQQISGKFNPISLTQSSIKNGMVVSLVEEGALTLNSQSSILKGLKSTQSHINFTILNESFISGDGVKGIDQNGGVIMGTLNQKAEIRDGLSLKNGVTNITLFNKSKISGDINAINNETTILIDDSEINGSITVNEGFLHLTAQNKSTITSPQMSVTNADLKLIVDTNSKFIGNLTQTNNKQEVVIKQGSEFQGSITNTNTTGTIMVNNATLTGNITQNGGKLGIDISNKGIVGGNITLNNANVNLSGSGGGNHIKGKFEQNDGTLTGAMNGLTLGGTYNQTGGTSQVSFTNSHFKSDTTITNAINSNLTFIKSTLKNYTISGGENNTLKLLDGTKMTGNLMLTNQAKALLKMENSTIDGDVIGREDSELNFNTINSTITGGIDFDTGGITGQTENTKINGNITLKDTHSNISFVKGSIVGGNLIAENGDNIIKFNASTINGGVTANGGSINLDLSNGSKVGQDVMFVDTKAHLTGSPAGNEIMGSFTTKGTTSRSMSFLTGDISSLTLHGTFTQNFGMSDIIFRQDSFFKGQVNINEANLSHLKFIDNSGIKNAIQITGGMNNQIDLFGKSFIQGNITTQNKSTTTITAQEGSFITGDIKATDALKTIISLNASTLNGSISQDNGEFYLNAKNSQITSSIAQNPYGLELSKVKAEIGLTRSVYETSIKAIDSSALHISLKDQSRLNSIQAPQSALLQNSSLKIISSASSVGLNINQSSDDESHTLDFIFTDSSIYNGSIDLNKIKSTMLFNDSKFISPEIKVEQGSLDLVFQNAKHETHLEENLELIQIFEASDTTIKIKAQDQSHAKITKAEFSNTELAINSSGASRLEGDAFTLKENSKATYRASSNGNINVNTIIDGNANTLTVTLEGGILLGSIVQDNFSSGDVTLKGRGWLGGRWAVSDDSRVKTLEIQNQDGAFDGRAIFKPSFDTPISLVDFTLNFEDHKESSRLNKEIVVRPDPLEDGTIPPPLDHQTYARTLFVDNLSGNNGLFRVYVDLGTALADKIVANRASGDHAIQVNYRSATFKEGARKDRIVVARVEDPNTKVSFKGIQSEVGLKKYDTEIIKENAQGGVGFEWIIGQVTPSGLSNSSKIIASILQNQYRTFAIETDSLDRRLGGLEKIQRDSGFWVRSFIGQASKDATDYSVSATDKYYSIWSGADYNARGLTGHNFLGVFFNYTGINTESKDYMGNSSNFAFGFYNVFKAHSGFYFDLLAKYIFTSSKFEISNYSLEKNHPKISNHKFLANFEMGYTFYLGEKRKSLYIEPQFQITSGYIQGYSAEFIDVGGERIEASVGHNAPVLMRLGTFVGREFGDKISANIKAGTSIAYDVNSGGELNFKDSSNVFKRVQSGDFRMLLSAHADFRFADSFRLYTSFDTSFFGSYNTVFNVNLGLRFVFGKRNNIVSDVPMVYNPYEPTPPPIDDRRTVPVIKGFTTKDIDTNYKGKRREVPSYNQNSVSSPVQGYAPQPMMRKNYRDEVNIINPNNGGNQ